MTAARRVAAVVLAAGSSARFGGDKLLETVDGRPLGEHIAVSLVDLLLDEYLAVCPAGDDVRRHIYLRHGFEIVENERPELGMGVSLALGANRALALDADVIVCLADMPNITHEHLAALLSIDAPIVATECEGVRSPPAVFSREHLAELAVLTGDNGARHLLKSAVAVHADPALVRDYDTPEDFA